MKIPLTRESCVSYGAFSDKDDWLREWHVSSKACNSNSCFLILRVATVILCLMFITCMVLSYYFGLWLAALGFLAFIPGGLLGDRYMKIIDRDICERNGITS